MREKCKADGKTPRSRLRCPARPHHGLFESLTTDQHRDRIKPPEENVSFDRAIVKVVLTHPATLAGLQHIPISVHIPMSFCFLMSYTVI